ncbi:unnamed protein product, partial [Owenia fusiformis]
NKVILLDGTCTMTQPITTRKPATRSSTGSLPLPGNKYYMKTTSRRSKTGPRRRTSRKLQRLQHPNAIDPLTLPSCKPCCRRESQQCASDINRRMVLRKRQPRKDKLKKLSQRKSKSKARNIDETTQSQIRDTYTMISKRNSCNEGFWSRCELKTGQNRKLFEISNLLNDMSEAVMLQQIIQGLYKRIWDGKSNYFEKGIVDPVQLGHELKMRLAPVSNILVESVDADRVCTFEEYSPNVREVPQLDIDVEEQDFDIICFMKLYT